MLRFNLHVYPQEALEHCIKIQIAGKTRWQLSDFGEPSAADSPQASPLDEPIWEGLLDEGDLLYVPRGWRYAATPCEKPAIHLDLAFRIPTGLGLLSWFIGTLSGSAFLKRDLPLFVGESAQREYLHAFCSHVRHALETQDLIGRFLRQENRSAQGRLSFGLPWCATDCVLPTTGGFLEIAYPRRLDIQRPEKDVLQVACGGAAVRFRPEALPLLTFLDDKASGVSMMDFIDAFREGFNQSQLREFLVALVELGLVTIRGEGRL